MAEQSENTKWMSVAEACAYLSVSKATLYLYMKDGRLPYYHLAGTHQRRVRKSDLEALLIPGRPEDVDTQDDTDDK